MATKTSTKRTSKQKLTLQEKQKHSPKLVTIKDRYPKVDKNKLTTIKDRYPKVDKDTLKPIKTKTSTTKPSSGLTRIKNTNSSSAQNKQSRRKINGKLW